MSNERERPENKETVAPDNPFVVESDNTGIIAVPSAARALVRANDANKIACLVLLDGMDIGNVIPLVAGKEILLGRGADCTVTLRDDGISRHHAKVRYTGRSSIELRDLRSTNGTFVSGRPIRTALLEHGEKILLGRKTVIKFVIQDDIDLQYQQEMFESSTRDGLTGAYNRKYLTQKIISDLSFARRHNLPFTFLMFDIDHFKEVNDIHGHQVGDAVLISVTRAVQKIMRAEDVLGRYGGEEFAVIAQSTPSEGAHIFGERVRLCIANSLSVTGVDGESVRVTVSVGVATINAGDSVDAPRLIAEADANMYRAKNNGRNQTISSVL